MFLFKNKLDDNTSAHILAAFAKWMQDEYLLYKGDDERCLLRNIATTHPSVFNDEKLGKGYIDRYFVMSNTADQRTVTRLAIFVSKLNLIFGDDIVSQFKSRCITSMIQDLHINKDLLATYFNLADLFWVYPVLLIIGNLELREPMVEQNEE